MDLLGSIGPRFVGENKTDIHLTNWRVNDELQPRRQRETTIAPGLTFITTEFSALSAAQLLAPGGPPADAWKYDVKWLATLEFTLWDRVFLMFYECQWCVSTFIESSTVTSC